MNPYEILEVEPDASREEIKAQYRRLAMRCHPDRCKNESDKRCAEKVFKEVAEAYEILSDPKRRKQYDETGNGGKNYDIELAALNEIMSIFIKLGRESGWKQGKYIQTMRETFTNSLENVEAERVGWRESRARMGTMIPHSAGAENIFAEAMINEQGKVDRRMEQIDNQEKILEIVFEKLSGYSDNLPPEDFVRITMDQAFSVTNGTSTPFTW